MKKTFYFAVPAGNQQIFLVLATFSLANSDTVHLKTLTRSCIWCSGISAMIQLWHSWMCQPPITTVFPWDMVKNQIHWPLLLKEFPECYRLLYKIAWTDFYCHHKHSFQQPLPFLNYLHVRTKYTVFDTRTVFNSGMFKGFPKSNLIWTVTTASCLFQGNSLIKWLHHSDMFKKDCNRLTPR